MAYLKRERITMEKRVKLSDIEFSQLLPFLPDLYLILCHELYILGASDAYLEATLTSRESIMGKYIFDVFPDNPDAAEANATKNLRESLELVLKSKKPHKMALQHYDIPRPGGGFEEKYWSPLNQPVLDDNGEIICIVHKATDVTEQVLMEKENVKNKELVREKETEHLLLMRVLEALPQIAWTACPKGNVNYFNKKWYTYTGKDFEQSKNRGWLKAVHPDDLQITANKWEESISTGKTFLHEHRLFMASDNSYRWHLSTAKFIKDESKTIILWVGASTDIHEQKIRVEKNDEFIGIASHELKTPITGMKGYLQIVDMLLSEKRYEDAKPYLDKALESINKLNMLVSDLADATKINSGKLQLYITEFDLDSLVDDIAKQFQYTHPSHKIIIEGTLGQKVSGDKNRIEQVLINYLTNAIKYSPAADLVIITVEKQDNFVQVAIKDFGIGIPKDEVKKVFTKYYRVEDRSTRFSGLGLGLNIACEIIKRHNGKVWVESEEEKGSTFYFRIPLSAPALTSKLRNRS
jgi:PAS domain S-box-containing protein